MRAATPSRSGTWLSALATSAVAWHPATAAVPFEQVASATAVVVPGLARASGCFGEDHRTWYGVRRRGSQQELVSESLAGGALRVIGALPDAGSPAAIWSPQVVAADASWAVMATRGRLVRWTANTGAVADLLARPMDSWDCKRVPGHSEHGGVVALMLERASVLLIDGTSVPQPALQVTGRRGFVDSACWCQDELWYPICSFDAVPAVRRLQPLSPPLTVRLTTMPAAANASPPSPAISEVLGRDSASSSLWALWDQQLVRINPTTGALVVVAAGMQPETAMQPGSQTQWICDPERDLVLAVTVTCAATPTDTASTASLPVFATDTAHVLGLPPMPSVRIATLVGTEHAVTVSTTRTYDLTAVWQHLATASLDERQHPQHAGPRWLIGQRILGRIREGLVLSLDCQLRYGVCGSVYDTILLLPLSAAPTAGTPIELAQIRHDSSGVADPITDYPVAVQDPGHAVALQFRDAALLLGRDHGP